MEANYPLSTSRWRSSRKLCHRSLSSFKRDFRKHFDETPGRWLLQRRLDYAAALLRSSRRERPMTDDGAFDSGFADDLALQQGTFKARFETSPTAYRDEEHSRAVTWPPRTNSFWAADPGRRTSRT